MAGDAGLTFSRGEALLMAFANGGPGFQPGEFLAMLCHGTARGLIPVTLPGAGVVTTRLVGCRGRRRRITAAIQKRGAGGPVPRDSHPETARCVEG